MPRPRRPILAAASAVLLLATAALWLRSQSHGDALAVEWHAHTVRLGTVAGDVYLEGEHWRIPHPQPLHLSATSTPTFQTTWTPGGFYHGRTRGKPVDTRDVMVPLALFLPIPVLALLWSLPRRKPPAAGFPVQPSPETPASPAAPSPMQNVGNDPRNS